MTEFHGMNRKFTPLAQIDGMSEYQKGTRLKIRRELQRRYGFAATTIPGAGAPILSIVSANVASGGAAVVTQTNVGGTISVQGTKIVKPLWTDIILKPPIGVSCTLFATLNDSGTTSKLSQLNPPINSCAGTITLQAYESVRSSGSSGRGFYGYLFVIECFDSFGLLATYTTTCLSNQIVTYPLPAGTTNVSYDITGGCAGGSTPGTWAIAVSTP